MDNFIQETSKFIADGASVITNIAIVIIAFVVICFFLTDAGKTIYSHLFPRKQRDMSKEKSDSKKIQKGTYLILGEWGVDRASFFL